MAATKKYSIYEASDILHNAGNLHTSTVHLDYGTGEKFTSTEVHTLSYIVDNPGISVTQLANDTGKTKGAISQMVKKLVEKDLIRRVGSPVSDRTAQLYATEAGMTLHTAHKQYDTISFGKGYKALCEMYTPDEVNAAWVILDSWVKIRRQMN